MRTITADRETAFAGPAAPAALVHAGEATPRELVELYLRRIDALDPRLNAFRVTLAEQALAEADALDGERRTRDHAQPVGPGANAGRLIGRIGGGGGSRADGGGDRVRRRRLDPVGEDPASSSGSPRGGSVVPSCPSAEEEQR